MDRLDLGALAQRLQPSALEASVLTLTSPGDCVLLQRDNLPSFLLSPPPSVKQERGYKASSGRCCRAVPEKRVLSGLPPPGWGAQSSQSGGRPLGESSTSTEASSVPSMLPSSGNCCSPPGEAKTRGAHARLRATQTPPSPGEPQHEVLFECFVTEC
ncbi:hypothetical protein F7725_017404 [Dissostichus mawsoni]|uniref:Uncharacterized protein n=1 Tax=Dissostichus mawsoni TaxID=36200 RepID=A0A7J5Z6B1_DISMA|nr:hypothetical protein F7725_017404 [Dissostichus mawsoni]